jgi:hypothetical protein
MGIVERMNRGVNAVSDAAKQAVSAGAAAAGEVASDSKSAPKSEAPADVAETAPAEDSAKTGVTTSAARATRATSHAVASGGKRAWEALNDYTAEAHRRAAGRTVTWDSGIEANGTRGSDDVPHLRKGQYEVVTRTFAQPKTFGFGFEGDDREFSADPTRSSRMVRSTVIDGKGVVESRAWSYASRGSGVVARGGACATLKSECVGTLEATASPEGYAHWSADRNRGGVIVEQHTEASMPLNRAAPNIDVDSKIHVAIDDRNVMTVRGTVNGDLFPNTELYMRDPAGNTMELSRFKTQFGRNIGPYRTLFGNDQHRMTQFEAKIQLDDDLNFQSVDDYAHWMAK